MVAVAAIGVVEPAAAGPSPDLRGGEPRCAGKAATLVGTAGADTLTGTRRADVIVSLGGDDEIRARGGGDVVCGGDGDDVVRGQAGADRLYGEAGEDTLEGSAGVDRLAGAGGEDHLLGGARRDRLAGGGGFDSCWGGPGRDRERGCERRSRRLANRVPKAADDEAATDELQPITIDVLANDSDPDRKPVSVKAVEYDETVGLVRIVNGGTAVRYEPGDGRFAAVGGGQTVSDRFTYVIGDARGGRSAADVTVRIAGIDDPPKAVGDTRTVAEDEAAELNLRANDTDVDGGPRLITGHTEPAYGEVEIVDFGADLFYTPDPGFCTTPGSIPDDTFTYTLNGGSQANVSVAIECRHDGDGDVTFATTPSLEPSFDRAITDYTIDCTGEPIDVFADSPPGVTVAIDGGPAQPGARLDSVDDLASGQAFTLEVDWGAGYVTTHYVRCLPPGFPDFTVEIPGTPQAEFYVVTPGISFGQPPPGASLSYAVVFDSNGVPVWWMRSADDSVPIDAKLLPNGNLAWMHRNGFGDPGMEERTPAGELARELDTVGGGADHHDVQLLPNGHYLIGRYFEVPGQNLSECGGPASGTLIDNEIQELDETGNLVWSWRASEHIDLDEVTEPWDEQFCAGNGDVFHWNSIEVDSDGYVLSFRHLDAVYRIDRATGAIDWKLGGTPRPESLTIVDDPLASEGALSGQHDARVRSDGTLTVHDNGSGLDRAPRAVRYEIDDVAGTATLLEDVRDPQAPTSRCCGSTRKLPGEEGNWVSSWGGHPFFTELTPAGEPVFRLTFAGDLHSYRAHPVMADELDREALRAGMDAQHPRD